MHQTRLEWKVVFRLWLFVDVLDYDIDCLSRKSLLQVDVPDKIDILEYRRRLELGGKYSRGQWLGDVGVMGSNQGGQAAEKKVR